MNSNLLTIQERGQAILKAFLADNPRNIDLIKGEGSRGGKIIGHTKSGKVIYEKHSAEHEHYNDFSAEEHKEAAEHHHKKALSLNNSTREASRAVKHNDLEYEHNQKFHQKRLKEQLRSAQKSSWKENEKG